MNSYEQGDILPGNASFNSFWPGAPISWLMARMLHHADTFLLRLSRGNLDLCAVIRPADH